MYVIIFLILIVVGIKIYNRVFFRMQMKKTLKNRKVKYINYDNYSEKEIKTDIDIKKFSFKSQSVLEEMSYNIIFPIDYDENKSYPVLYMLHGLRDESIFWVEKAKLGEIYYELLREKKIEPMLLVLPESGFEGRSWYTNWKFEEGRRYEDYFTKDLINHVENSFKCSDRGITGFSMGGYGAVKMGLKHLGLYSNISSFAGAINFPRLFIAELKGLGLLKHMRTNKFMTKTEDSKHFARVFGNRLKFFRNENVYNILRKVVRHDLEKLQKIDFLLSVGEKDNSFYTMVYQWEDVIGEFEKRNLKYQGRLVKGAEHTWSYVERELPAVLKFHSDKFKGDTNE